MPTCFVIQPFDGGVFDDRYEDVFRPAIEAANLEPYRVDRDPSISIPIDEIENGIRDAAVCLADITEDNPNVWFELGFAIAERKEVALLCSEERDSQFPFDIQHRHIIRYRPGSLRDFHALRERITERLGALLKKTEKLDQASRLSPVRDVEGLEQHEMVALISVAENINAPDEVIYVHSIRRDMERAGFTKIATTLGLGALLNKSLVKNAQQEGDHGEVYTGYSLTEAGMRWLMTNQDQLVLKKEEEDDDIPF